LRSGVEVALAEPDLAEEVIRVGDGQQLLEPVVPGQVVLRYFVHQGLGLVEEFADADVIAADGRQVAQDREGGRVEHRPQFSFTWR